MMSYKKIIAVCLFILAGSGVVFFYLSLSPQKTQPVANNYTNSNGNAVKLPTKVEAMKPVDETVISPDGKASLVMKVQIQDGMITYSFYNSDEFILSKTTSGKISLPFNTWSTDDKHFFIKEEINGQNNYYSEPGDINVTQKFAEKFPDYKFQEITGWADKNLLIVNANDGTNDISFWFDITSQSFIRLSGRFN